MDNSAAAPPVSPLCNRVELQLLTTLECNLRCTYCSLGPGSMLDSQKNATYTPAQLETFVRTHLADKDIYITLYGGEPLLNPEFGLELMDRFPAVRFNLQSNGTLLDSMPEVFLKRLSNVMVSIDGGEAVNDAFRGPGTYRRVIESVRRVRPVMFGTLTARVTWWSADTTFEELDALLADFDHLYFQFAQDRGAYGPGMVERKREVLSRLIDRFFEGDKLYPVVPVMGIVRNKVVPNRINELSAGLTQCRVSSNLLNVMPDGRVYPCPDLLYAGELLQGDVVGNWLERSPLQPHPDAAQTPA